MKLPVLSLSLALAAVPARAGYSIRIQRAQGPVTTAQFQPKSVFVLQDRRDLESMIGTLRLENRPTPQYYSLLSAGEGLLEKGLVAAVPVGQEVYFLSQDLQDGEVVSLKDDQSFDTPYTADTFRRLKKALKKAGGAADVETRLLDLSRLYDAADSMPAGYRGYTAVAPVAGSRDLLLKLKPRGRGKAPRLARFEPDSKSVEVLPGSARFLPLKDVVLSTLGDRLVSLKGDTLLSRDMKTGKTEVVAEKFQRAVAVSANDVMILKDGKLSRYHLPTGKTSPLTRYAGIEFSDVSSDGRFAVGVRRGPPVLIVVFDLRTGKIAKSRPSGPVDVKFYEGDAEYVAVYEPNNLDPWAWDWRRD